MEPNGRTTIAASWEAHVDTEPTCGDCRRWMRGACWELVDGRPCEELGPLQAVPADEPMCAEGVER